MRARHQLRHSVALAAYAVAAWGLCLVAGYGVMVLMIPGGLR